MSDHKETQRRHRRGDNSKVKVWKIYLLGCVSSGKKYVGQTYNSLDYRWKTHIRQSRRFQSNYLARAIRKYGPKSFKISLLTTASTQKKAHELEKSYIKKLNTQNCNFGYNLTSGGEGVVGLSPSIETRKKLSEAGLGRKVSEETRLKISLSCRGKRHTEATKMRLRRIRLGTTLSAETRKKISLAGIGRSGTMLGKKHSQRAKEKISKAARGLAADPAWIKKVSESTRLALHRPETRKRHLIGLKKARLKRYQ